MCPKKALDHGIAAMVIFPIGTTGMRNHEWADGAWAILSPDRDYGDRDQNYPAAFLPPLISANSGERVFSGSP